MQSVYVAANCCNKIDMHLHSLWQRSVFPVARLPRSVLMVVFQVNVSKVVSLSSITI